MIDTTEKRIIELITRIEGGYKRVSNMNSLAEKLKRAKAVMQATTTPEFDVYTRELREGGYMNNPSMNDGYTMIPQQTASSFSSNPYSTRAYEGNITEGMAERSKLPKEILNSLTSKPINVPSISMADDGVNKLMSKVQEGAKKYMSKDTKPKFSQVMNETAQQQQQPVIMGSSNIDYSLVKTIVEDVVKRYASALKKQILSEVKGSLNESTGGKASQNSLYTMMIGNKFSFVDDEGNLYEAELKYKGNVKGNSKKK